MRYDTIIKNGIVVDGRRNPRVKADLGIKDGVIADMGLLDPSDGRHVLNAEGLVVAPGFIDLHTHYDSQLFWDPYCSTSGWHGTTTVIVGNCGYGFAPCRVEERDAAMRALTRVTAVPFSSMQAGLPWDWITFPDYMASVGRVPKAINVAVNVPLNQLMIWVMGVDRAKAGALPTSEEHREMARLLGEAIDAGAVGFSAQRLGEGTFQPDPDGRPHPTDLLHDETMFALADVLRKRNDGMIQYAYPELAEYHNEPGSQLADSNGARLHVEELARRSGRSVVFLPHLLNGGLEWARECQKRGIPVYANRLVAWARSCATPVNIASAVGVFDSISPTWRRAINGSLGEVKVKLSDPGMRAQLREEFSDASTGTWILVDGKTPETAKYNGMSVAEIAVKSGKKESCIDIFLDITIAEDLSTEWSIPGTAAGIDDLKRLADDDYSIPGLSDGGAHTKYASAAYYPTYFLMSYVRDHGWLSLEDAHYRLSALPAHVAGLERNMGTLAIGAPADIVVYDFERLSVTEPQKVYDCPAAEWRIADHGIGYRWVLVNGEIVIEDDNETKARPGRVVCTEQHRRKSLT